LNKQCCIVQFYSEKELKIMSTEVNRNILIAADESENAERAIIYVGKLLGGIKGFKVTVLHIIREPEDDFFQKAADKHRWYSEYCEQVGEMLEKYRNILIEAGFRPEDVSTHSTTLYCHSMAECILAERDNTEYSTLVVGRKGLTHKEEFLFGSVSGKIVRTARNCTVWVVE
jgi:nucleotide-binding universal stress UspA family protein